MAEAAPENADFARDLWVCCWRMAKMDETEGRTESARRWWRLAYDTVCGMKQRGMFISPEDEPHVRRLADKAGRG